MVTRPTIPSTDTGSSRAIRRSIPPTSPLRVPWTIPARTNSNRRLAPMLTVVAYGPVPVMNQSAWTFGSVESRKKLKTPPTTQITASTTHATRPPMMTSKPAVATSPTKPVTLSITQPTGLGKLMPRITRPAPRPCG
jgi:hypothetical protein